MGALRAVLGALGGSWGVLGTEDGKTQKSHVAKTWKYITHKGSNAFPEKRRPQNTTGRSILGGARARNFLPWRLTIFRQAKIQKRAPGGSSGPTTKKHKNCMRKKQRNTLRTKAQTHFRKKRRLQNTTGRSILGGPRGRQFPALASWKISARRIEKSQETAIEGVVPGEPSEGGVEKKQGRWLLGNFVRLFGPPGGPLGALGGPRAGPGGSEGPSWRPTT